jgi:hypothetical protein
MTRGKLICFHHTLSPPLLTSEALICGADNPKSSCPALAPPLLACAVAYDRLPSAHEGDRLLRKFSEISYAECPLASWRPVVKRPDGLALTRRPGAHRLRRRGAGPALPRLQGRVLCTHPYLLRTSRPGFGLPSRGKLHAAAEGPREDGRERVPTLQRVSFRRASGMQVAAVPKEPRPYGSGEQPC